MSYRLLPLAPMGAPVTPTDVSFVMAPAIRGAVADGPFVSQPGTIVPPLDATLYRRADLNDPVVTFDQSFARKWQDQLNESGHAELAALNDDPDLAFLSPGHDVIRFTVNGYAAFTWLIRSQTIVAIAEGEEHDQITTLSGPGHVAIFDEALVYPARGPGVQPIEEDRVFNWTSVDYNDVGWTNAHAVMTVGEAQTSWQLLPFGDGFPTASVCYVIWTGPIAATAAPPGDCYFRREYTSTGGALFYVCIDDGGEVYLDGQLIMTCASGFGMVYTMSLPDVTPGPHTIAVHGQNGPGAPDAVFDNPAGVAVQVYPCNANGEPSSSTPDVVTDDSWKLCPYPPSPPGMTPGEVLIHCVNEAKARGCLPPVTYAFDEETDSAGNPWPEVTDISTKTGTDCLTFFRELSATYVDFWLEPATWTLWAWVRDQRGWQRLINLRPVSDANDPWSGNLAGLQFDKAL